MDRADTLHTYTMYEMTEQQLQGCDAQHSIVLLPPSKEPQTIAAALRRTVSVVYQLSAVTNGWQRYINTTLRRCQTVQAKLVPHIAFEGLLCKGPFAPPPMTAKLSIAS